MSSRSSSLGTLKVPIKCGHIPWTIDVCKYRSSLLESFPFNGRSSFCLPETKSFLWAEAQNSMTTRSTQTREVTTTTLPSIDESWKEHDSFSGQGWYRRLEGFTGLMGARILGRLCHHFTQK